MKGSHRIRVSGSRVRYDFTVRRNITILKGDSATGKTTLVEMIGDYYENGENSGITLSCDKECRVVGGREWHTLLAAIHDSIVFIDDDNSFLPSVSFAEAVRDSDNYYVIVTREGLPNLPYSVTEIYGIRTSGKYGGLKQTYNEFYRIYGDLNPGAVIHPDTLLVEDSNAGCAFWEGSTDLPVRSAGGNAGIFRMLLTHREGKLLVIADGAAFGAEMDRVMKRIRMQKDVWLWLPESFEWLILSSGLIDGNRVRDILADPSGYVQSEQYFSWEQFFTALLVAETKDTYLSYNKKKLNPAYLNAGVAEKILRQLPDFVQLDRKHPQGEEQDPAAGETPGHQPVQP